MGKEEKPRFIEIWQFLARPCPSSPLERAPHGQAQVREGSREVPHQPRRLPRNSRPAILWDPGPRPERDKLPDPGSRPPPPAHGLRGGSDCQASRRLSRPPRASGARLPPRPRPGPREAALPVNSPPGTAPLPASAPPSGGPERRVIGPVAPSLSGRVTALVSDRPETGSGVSARGAAAEGVALPCSLRLARGSAP